MNVLAGLKKAKTAELTTLSIANTVGDEVPILMEVLNIANMVQRTVEQLDSADAKLLGLLRDVKRIDPTCISLWAITRTNLGLPIRSGDEKMEAK